MTTSGRSKAADLAEQSGAPYLRALVALMGCFVVTLRLLVTRATHLRKELLGLRLHFGDGTSARVFRETVVDGDVTDPCVLVVCFRLRFVKGLGHDLFRAESLLNTPLFVGFPGFVSKLWIAHDENGSYRGLYEWDGPNRAEHYARCLWRVLALVSAPGSIHYKVLPSTRRDTVLSDSAMGPNDPRDDAVWWRVVSVG